MAHGIVILPVVAGEIGIGLLQLRMILGKTQQQAEVGGIFRAIVVGVDDGVAS